ncbi:nucleotidyl transferase AbiEii/AbiGii toxin family protein [Microbulbifer magnicolonia]|uniref:nucleotidyl transferase AbiEii/AbiGii toxin family protein n=1 Tax=Microbulbifer magnicolonia TaxID=3109744 RepID=UPI002B40336A|nr:nucleotidyl transferase AbiEii/AbiGii toxin family protein [Microbulbifer sp. GG15]
MNLRNIELLELVAYTIGEELNQQVVYIGGSTTALLVAPERRGQVRQTKDVDIVIDVVTTRDYHAFCDQLKARGFREDQSEDALICRYCLRDFPDVRLDVMPTDERILGFANRWYPATIAQAFSVDLGRASIRVAKPVYFLATKFEAWHGRGRGDIFAHDMEDILFVFEHRPEIVGEVTSAEDEIRNYLSRQAASLLESNLVNYLDGFTETESAAVEIQNRLFRVSRL